MKCKKTSGDVDMSYRSRGIKTCFDKLSCSVKRTIPQHLNCYFMKITGTNKKRKNNIDYCSNA